MRLIIYGSVIILLSFAGCSEKDTNKEIQKQQSGVSKDEVTNLNQEQLYFIENIGKENIYDAKSPKGIKRTDISVPSDMKELLVFGWAVDASKKKPAKEVFVIIDDKEYRTTYGLDREDIAKGLKDEYLKKTGFEVRVPLTTISKGSHKLYLSIVRNDDTRYESQLKFNLKVY